jgi:hypothetical protein
MVPTDEMGRMRGQNAVRRRWRSRSVRRLGKLFVSSMVAGVWLSLAHPAGAQPSMVSCLTKSDPATSGFMVGACPSGSPAIVGFAVQPGVSVTRSGAVYGRGGQSPGMNGHPLAEPIVAIAPGTPVNGDSSYYLVGSDGGIFTFQGAMFYGSMGGTPLNAPVVGTAPTNDGRGYWVVAADGGVFTFGDAGYFGSMGGRQLNSPVVGMAPTGDGMGYWLVAADGGVFSFGNASFHGSMGGQNLSAPVVGMSPTASGYFLAGADGGIFTFGDARFGGSGVGSVTSRVIGVSTVDTALDPISPPFLVPEIATTSGEQLLL